MCCTARRLLCWAAVAVGSSLVAGLGAAVGGTVPGARSSRATRAVFAGFVHVVILFLVRRVLAGLAVRVRGPHDAIVVPRLEGNV